MREEPGLKQQINQNVRKSDKRQKEKISNSQSVTPYRRHELGLIKSKLNDIESIVPSH
jgi:hypothetical protein